MSDLSIIRSVESKVAEFAAFCAFKIDVHNPPSCQEGIEEEIKSIASAYGKVFGCDPSGETIVRIQDVRACML